MHVRHSERSEESTQFACATECWFSNQKSAIKIQKFIYPLYNSALLPHVG